MQEIDKLRKAAKFAQLKGRISTAMAYMMEDGIPVFGIDTITASNGQSLRYVSRGDSYTPTVCEYAGNFFVGDWGDWLETVEQESVDSLPKST